MITRLLTFVLILSILNVIRHIYYMIQSLLTNERYVISKFSLYQLGFAIAYMFTIIITGIK